MKEAIEILSKGVDRRVGAVRVEGKPAWVTIPSQTQYITQ